MLDDRQARGLAWICDRTERLRTLADRKGERTELDLILTELTEPAADVAALLRRTSQLLRRCGVPGALRDGVPELTDTQGGHPVEEFYLCPRQEEGRCSRLVHAFDVTAGAEVPSCRITGLPLLLRRW